MNILIRERSILLSILLMFVGLFSWLILDHTVVSAEEIEWELATDDDFSGKVNFGFQYIGEGEYVEIPHSIKGEEVTGYQNMFKGYSGSQLKGVKSTNKNVTDMDYMFEKANGLTELDLSNLDTSNVTSMQSMFDGASRLTELDVSKFDTSKVTNMQRMFYGMGGIKELEVSNFDTSKVMNMERMFYGASGLTELDLSTFDTSKVTNMLMMFANASSLTELEVSSFDTSNVTNMTSMFLSLRGMKELDVSNFDTSKVTRIGGMFSDASSLTELDVSNFDTSNVTDISGMFFGARSLEELDVSNFNTTNVKSMESMFSGASSLKKLDLSSFDTSNVKSMRWMFKDTTSLTELDLSRFDTSKVTDMGFMFDGASGLTELDLSSFDISNVTDVNGMFKDISVNEVYVRTQEDIDRFNNRSDKPEGLEFVLKGVQGTLLGQNNLSASVLSGGLHLEVPNKIIDFGDIIIGAEPVTKSVDFDSPLTVSDLRGTGEGWNLKVSASPFESVEGDGLPVGSLGLNILKSIHTGSVEANKPSIELTERVLLDDGVSLVADAQAGKGMGVFDLEFEEEALSLIIDSSTAKKGDYESVITWTLESTPSGL